MINIPSGNERPTDITDFQLRHDFLTGVQSNADIVLICIMGYMKDWTMCASATEFKEMLSVISYELTIFTNKAVLVFDSTEGIDNAFEKAEECVKNIAIFSDESCWFMAGSNDLSAKSGIDNVSIEDFINGTGKIEKSFMGTQRGEKEQED